MEQVAWHETRSRAEGLDGFTVKGDDRLKFKLPILPPSSNDTPKPKPKLHG